MRDEELTFPSDFVAVRVVCNGRPNMNDKVLNSRWKSYVGVPLFWDNDPLGPVPAGAVVLASKESGSSSSIRDTNGAAVTVAMEQMREVGRQVIVP